MSGAAKSEAAEIEVAPQMAEAGLKLCAAPIFDPLSVAANGQPSLPGHDRSGWIKAESVSRAKSEKVIACHGNI
jgi:hypothetical protein